MSRHDLGTYTEREHAERHQLLAEHLGELLTDFVLHHPGRREDASITALELLEWGRGESRVPTLHRGGVYASSNCS